MAYSKKNFSFCLQWKNFDKINFSEDKLLPKNKRSIKVEKTIQNIKTVFEKLICEKNFEEIKVSQIVKGAKINIGRNEIILI